MLRFATRRGQHAARDAVVEQFADTYITALTHEPRAPGLLRALGLRPIDLRGGVSVLFQVDVQAAVGQALDGYEQETRRALSDAAIPYKDVVAVSGTGHEAQGLTITLPPDTDVGKVRSVLAPVLRDLVVSTASAPTGSSIQAVMPQATVKEQQNHAMEQAITVLRNRVNELGVAQPTVQQQGIDRINVQLPDVSSSSLLGRVAAPIYQMEERTVGTSLSLQNIEHGVRWLIIGMLGVLLVTWGWGSAVRPSGGERSIPP